MNVVKWDIALSLSFSSKIGVDKGRVLSPVLFNNFIEDLNAKMSSINVNCYTNGVWYNHVTYADDCVLLAPSVRALEIRIDESISFAH